jgi:hypothetical protein
VTPLEYARTLARRWSSPRREGAGWDATRVPQTPSPRPATGSGEQGTPRPARTLMAGDDVLVADRWVEIVRAEPVREDGAAFMLLTLADGSLLTAGYQSLVCSRDAEEQALAAKEGAL